MTSKELIEHLQQLDPEGNIHVCVENQPIIFVEKMKAGDFGDLQLVNTDCTALKFMDEGEKIKLHIVSLDELIDRCPQLRVVYSSERAERNNSGIVQAAKMIRSPVF